jgi:regulator of sigma E protease
MDSAFSWLITLVVFGAIIVVHEFGHFIVAKMSGMLVPEFSIGFGPALWKRQIGETLYALRIIPLGGYVRIAGMEPGEDEGKETPQEAEEIRSYNTKPFYAKFLTIFAGAAMNFVLAFFIFIAIGLSTGYPVGSVFVRKVMPGSAAADAGLQPRDRIVRIGNTYPVQSNEVALEVILARPGTPIAMVVDRGGREHTLQVTPRTLPGVKGPKIGVEMENVSRGFERLGFERSIARGTSEVVGQTRMMLISLGMLFTGRVGFDGVMGPPAIIGMTNQLATQAQETSDGRYGLLMWWALISMNIGLINLLPLPALDGSRLVIIVIEKLRGKPFNRHKEALVHLVGLVLLFSLIAFISVKEIGKMISDAQKARKPAVTQPHQP